MQKANIAAWLVAAVSALVFLEAYRWTMEAARSYQSDGSGVMLGIWIACCVVTLAGTAGSIWLAIKTSAWNRGHAFTLGLVGMLVSLIGAVQYYVDMLLSAQGVFYRAWGSAESLSRARLGLGMCAVTFVACTIGLLRTAVTRQQ
jgi:hypothetical protein